MIRLWNRLVKMNHDRLTKRVFLWDHSLKINNWSAEVEHLLGRLNMRQNFDNYNICNLDTVKSNLHDNDEVKWREGIRDKPKLRTYKKMKNDYCLENYVKLNLSRSERSHIAQLRCGVLPLIIETGRFRGEGMEDRKCNFCSTPGVDIEDEFHFMFKCDRYAELREQFLENVRGNVDNFDTLENGDKLKGLMIDYPRQTAKYINRAMDIRRKLDYVMTNNN